MILLFYAFILSCWIHTQPETTTSWGLPIIPAPESMPVLVTKLEHLDIFSFDLKMPWPIMRSSDITSQYYLPWWRTSSINQREISHCQRVLQSPKYAHAPSVGWLCGIVDTLFIGSSCHPWEKNVWGPPNFGSYHLKYGVSDYTIKECTN